MIREQHLEYWLDVSADLLQRPLRTFPYVKLARHLLDTFELTSVVWEWQQSSGMRGFQFFGDEGKFTPAVLSDMHARDVLRRHPLLRWFAVSGDPAALSVEQVPKALMNQRERDWWDDGLVPLAVEKQLSIPCWLRGNVYGAFVLARTVDEFSQAEIDLARQLQRLMVGIERQVVAHVGAPPAGVCAAADAGLTAAEAAVLMLLAQGHTAHGIATRVASSPRTVQKHLEHIYRKLGVRDRLAAVEIGRQLGVISS